MEIKNYEFKLEKAVPHIKYLFPRRDETARRNHRARPIIIVTPLNGADRDPITHIPSDLESGVDYVREEEKEENTFNVSSKKGFEISVTMDLNLKTPWTNLD